MSRGAYTGSDESPEVRWLLDRPHHSIRQLQYVVTVVAKTGEIMTERDENFEVAIHRLMERERRALARKPTPDSAVPTESETPETGGERG